MFLHYLLFRTFIIRLFLSLFHDSGMPESGITNDKYCYLFDNTHLVIAALCFVFPGVKAINDIYLYQMNNYYYFLPDQKYNKNYY